MAIPAPAYMRIRNYIVGLVQRSSGTPEKIASEKELGEMFDVSRGTVRKALGDLVKEGYIVPKRGMGTYINPAKTPAKTGMPSPKIIGVITSNGMLVHYTQDILIMLGTALKELGRLDCTVKIINLAHQNKEAVVEIESLELDGLIWLAPRNNVGATIEILSSHNYPMVVLDVYRKSKCKNFVRLSNVAGLIEGAEYLISRGHRNIVYAGTWSKVPDLANDYSDLKKVFRKSGIPVRKELCLKYHDRLSSFTQLLKERKCSAVISQGGDWIKTILKVLEESTDRLPKNFELVTFDSPLLNQYDTPFKIRRIRIPIGEGARRAAQEIAKIVKEAPNKPVQEIIAAKLLKD